MCIHINIYIPLAFHSSWVFSFILRWFLSSAFFLRRVTWKASAPSNFGTGMQMDLIAACLAQHENFLLWDRPGSWRGMICLFDDLSIFCFVSICFPVFVCLAAPNRASQRWAHLIKSLNIDLWWSWQHPPSPHHQTWYEPNKKGHNRPLSPLDPKIHPNGSGPGEIGFRCPALCAWTKAPSNFPLLGSTWPWELGLTGLPSR